METTDGSGFGIVGRGGQLRGVPAAVRRSAVRLLAVSGGRSFGRRGRYRRRRWRWRGRRLGRGRRAVRRGPVLPAGGRGRGRRVHAPEAAGLQAVPRDGRRRAGRRRGRRPPPPPPPPPAPSHTAAAAAAARPSAVLRRRRTPSGRDAAHAGPQPDARTAAIVAGLAVPVDDGGGQPTRFGGRRRRRIRFARCGRLSATGADTAQAAVSDSGRAVHGKRPSLPLSRVYIYYYYYGTRTHAHTQTHNRPTSRRFSLSLLLLLFLNSICV